MNTGLDTILNFETPEGIQLQIRPAGPVIRACAWVIDAGIRLLFYLLILLLFAFLGGLGMGVILIGFFLIEWFYPVFFELRSGATPGKRIMGVWVIQDDGTPVAWSASLIRNLLRAADFLPLLYGFGLISMLANNQFKRLGDLAAGTLVVYREAAIAFPTLPEVEPLPPPLTFPVEDQRVFLTFAERCADLSPGRRVELAGLLAGITGATGQQAVDRVNAYAKWIAGGSRANAAEGI